MSIKPRGNSFLLGLFLHSAVDDAGLGVYEFRVYAHLCRRAGDELRVWEGQKKIAAVCGMSRSQVQRALYALQERGWIELEKDFRDDGSQKPNNIYLIGPSQVQLTPPASDRGTPAPVGGTPRTNERQGAPQTEAAKGNPVEGNPGEGIKPLQGAEIPDWLPEEAWGDFLQYRKELKAPVTPLMAKRLLSTLTKLRAEGHDPVQVIDQSIATGKWTGLFPVKGSGGAARRPVSTDEANQQFMQKMQRRSAALDGVFDE